MRAAGLLHWGLAACEVTGAGSTNFEQTGARESPTTLGKKDTTT